MENTAKMNNQPAIMLALAGLIEEHKGEETLILDVHEECSFADFFILTTVRSSRHAASLSGYIKEYCRAQGWTILNNSHRIDESGWLLIDCGWFLVHVMEKTTRSFYELEKLWFKSRRVVHSSKSS